MPVTRTEQTEQRKAKERADSAAYQKDLQALKVDRDRRLAAAHADRDAAQRSLTVTHREAVRKIWDEFHGKARDLRAKRKGKTDA